MAKGIFIDVATGETVERDLTPEEIAEMAEPADKRHERLIGEATQARRNAYLLEADPLFFGWQRGENTEQEWLDKVAEIRARYPYPA